MGFPSLVQLLTFLRTYFPENLVCVGQYASHIVLLGGWVDMARFARQHKLYPQVFPQAVDNCVDKVRAPAFRLGRSVTLLNTSEVFHSRENAILFGVDTSLESAGACEDTLAISATIAEVV